MRVDRDGNMHGLDNDGEPMPPDPPRSRVKVKVFKEEGLIHILLTSPRIKQPIAFAVTKEELKVLLQGISPGLIND